MSKSRIEAFGQHFTDFDTPLAFEFYELARSALPTADFPKHSKKISSIVDIADEIDVFVFDAFGVLNVGGSAIEGAAQSIEKVRSLGKRVFVLTNAATYPVEKNVAKYGRLGIPFSDSEVISSRMAAVEEVNASGIKRWGVMGKDDSDPTDFDVETRLLREDENDYDWADAFLLLTTWQWDDTRQKILEQALLQQPRRVVVANPDVIAPLEKRFSTEPGFTGHRLKALFGIDVDFHGKPFSSVYELLMQRLPDGQDRSKICMVGDTLHTDVLGGAASSWKTVLVADHGLFRNCNVEDYIAKCGIVPDFITPSI